jgi:hypothetical protein
MSDNNSGHNDDVLHFPFKKIIIGAAILLSVISILNAPNILGSLVAFSILWALSIWLYKKRKHMIAFWGQSQVPFHEYVENKRREDEANANSFGSHNDYREDKTSKPRTSVSKNMDSVNSVPLTETEDEKWNRLVGAFEADVFDANPESNPDDKKKKKK